MSQQQYIVSARKYRPSTFGTLVGQDAIADTLRNSIKKDQLAQAFLFCGSRGVGKTSTARILAKTINCQNLSENIEACNKCESCKSFNEGRSLNVYELDAASNNSVDDIRSLIDQVRIAPQMGTKKVYIIDEVHMLSQAAFNAFLKTLEEPPSHAIFILATTEKFKIIPTILSRCQIFDFHRIRIPDMVKHLSWICGKEENIQFEEKALHVIAEKADGALRDALSIFDQMVAFCQGNLTYDAVVENLHVLDSDTFFRVSDAAKGQNIPSALMILDEILQRGFDLHQFLEGLAGHYRNILLAGNPESIQILEMPDDVKERYVSEASGADPEMLLTILSILRQADVDFRTAHNKRLLVEITLMQLCSNTVLEEKKKPLSAQAV